MKLNNVAFGVGISNHPWIGLMEGWHPTSLYSLVVGFVVYWVLASAGMEPQTVEMPQFQAEAASEGEPSPAEGTQSSEGATDDTE